MDDAGPGALPGTAVGAAAPLPETGTEEARAARRDRGLPASRAGRRQGARGMPKGNASGRRGIPANP